MSDTTKPEFNAESRQQVEQYKNALNELRTAISNLDKPLSTISTNLKTFDRDLNKFTETVTKLSTQNNNLAESNSKIKTGISETISSFTGWNSIVGLATKASGGWGIAISAALTILSQYSDSISTWAANLFKGKTTLSAFGQVMKDNGIIAKALLETKLESAKNAQSEITDLNVLYKATQSNTLSKVKQKEAVRALKEQWPETFKNISDETILAGKAATAYKGLKEQIMATAFAEAAKNKITENAGRILGNTQRIAEERTKNLKLVKEEKIAQDKLNEAFKHRDFEAGGMDVIPYDNILKDIRKKRAASDKIIYNLTTDNNIHSKQNDLYYQQIEKDINSFNLRLSKSNAPGKSIQVNTQKEEPRQYETLEAKSVGFEINTGKTEFQKTQETTELDRLKAEHDAKYKIEEENVNKKITLEERFNSAKIHAGDKFIDAALKNSKKDSAIYKAAFLAKKAISIADTIISTKRAVMDSFKAYAGIPFVGQALGIIQAVFMAGQGAMSIAEIAKQKPGFAKGGQFRSDGRGSLLSGYSRMDDTNAYLRSGEAVVVSEAMRNPWARNLVSAINVAYGGRDFSVTNPNRGYAIGGIFTDGGNSNRYYNQPMNDQKDLANTIAYQMINNFPPVYVDVKDINTQQNIMAQTINRVNL